MNKERKDEGGKRGMRYKLKRWIYHALLRLAFKIGPPDRKAGGYWLYHEGNFKGKSLPERRGKCYG